MRRSAKSGYGNGTRGRFRAVVGGYGNGGRSRFHGSYLAVGVNGSGCIIARLPRYLCVGGIVGRYGGFELSAFIHLERKRSRLQADARNFHDFILRVFLVAPREHTNCEADGYRRHIPQTKSVFEHK
jgi:hypothetical protein